MPKFVPGEKITIPTELVQKAVDRIAARVVIRALQKEKQPQKEVSNR